jgi:hypothetical protein
VEGVKHLLEDWRDLRFINDLQGMPRVAAARKPEHTPWLV